MVMHALGSVLGELDQKFKTSLGYRNVSKKNTPKIKRENKI